METDFMTLVQYIYFDTIILRQNITTPKRNRRKKLPSFLKRDLNWNELKGTLMQIWNYANIFVFIWKQYVEDVTLKHLLLFEICAREICEKIVYKRSVNVLC